MKARSTISDLVRKCYAAYESKDRKAIEELLSDDFTFSSPLDDHIDKALYMKRCWPNSENIRAFHIEKLFEKNNEAFVRYEGERFDGGKFRCTEFFRSDGNRIKEVEVYFASLLTPANRKAADEAHIRELIDGQVAAVRAKNLGAATSNDAPDMVSFDVVNPLQRVGSDGSRNRAQEWFASFAGPIGYEIRDLAVAARDDVAFSHCLNRYSGTTVDGRKIDMWVRATACYRKIDGKWMVAHEHQSVPFDAVSGKASLGLKP